MKIIAAVLHFVLAVLFRIVMFSVLACGAGWGIWKLAQYMGWVT
jgi:hypothetical protein